MKNQISAARVIVVRQPPFLYIGARGDGERRAALWYCHTFWYKDAVVHEESEDIE
jgi:hypothetical protein